jgi:NAD(P)H dehydrogenase (quinone)
MIVVTSANGRLGRLVIAGLKGRIPADRKVLLISGSEVGRRVPQHTAVVSAAKEAGVTYLAYTSAPRADTTGLHVAAEHKATERVIRDSVLAFTFLRNGWYTENYTAAIRDAARAGSFYGSAHGGRVASAPISDYAAGAVAVLTGSGHEGQIYELSGDVAWTHEDLAREISAVTGKTVTYQDLSPQAHKDALIASGLPEAIADRMVAGDASTAQGFLAEASGQLRQLIGRPTVPLRDTIAEILKPA